MVNVLYIKLIASIFKFPSIGGVPEGRGGPQNENEIENEYVREITCFPYSFSKSISFCGFEGLHRLADICRPFRAWSGMGGGDFFNRRERRGERRDRRGAQDCVF